MIEVTVKHMVMNNNKVHFVWYQKGMLWYRVSFPDPNSQETMLYEFPVPIEDAGDAAFHAEDKALLFMRYIRKHLELEGSGRTSN